MAKICIDDAVMDNVEILAKLKLNGEARVKAKAELQKMLDYMNKLEAVDTTGVEPMLGIYPLKNVFREDVVVNGDDREAMLANAPKQKEGQYQVPKTVV